MLAGQINVFSIGIMSLVLSVFAQSWAIDSSYDWKKFDLKVNGEVQASAIVPDSRSIESTNKELVPRGSAVITKSGDLEESGIQYVIHAAPGSMGRSGGQQEEPTLTSVRESIIASLKLADIYKIKSIAIPLIGGGIFLSRISAAENREVSQVELAKTIILAARDSGTQLKVVFVGYQDEATRMREGFSAAKAIAASELAEKAKIEKLDKSSAVVPTAEPVKKEANWLVRAARAFLQWLKKKMHEYSIVQMPMTEPILISPAAVAPPPEKDFFSQAEVVSGSLVDFSSHHCESIVNAANMEVRFGGGLSGRVGDATKISSEIDQIASDLIAEIHKESK